ncbi:hypothetical protein SETIT_3G350400v2 [Setaria italica]|uniref:Protein kinase domain-containing protein n=1 Tax=Setaria italica TaxID=4555 RepID=A0A368QMI3_SETIT|nr:probable L-type lectin-domain containing receptor kinase S.7 [Setaria italica]RCV19024.1 hypothetical protein SETIT_3G350400v2 [Setaria italica]
MELCVPRRWPSPCSTGSLLIGVFVLVSLLFGVAVRRLCCQSRPVGHAADEEAAAAVEDRSKNFSNKFIFRTFAVAAQQRVLEHDDPKSIPPTMVRSPRASPEPAWVQRLSSPQATPISPSPLSVPGGQDPPPAVEPCLPPDFSPVSQTPLKEFSYKSLEDATRHFDSGNKLGRGESGTLYTGDLVFDDGINQEVAIKMFHNIIDCKQVREDLRQKKYSLRHRNLVALFGYCLHEGRLFLVYDRMHCYSLDYKLFDKEGAAAKPVLTLAQCYSIIEDVARGLYQLHKCQVFHGAVKASNIMLEPCSSGFRARLGDFRYSKLLIQHASDLKTTLGSLMMLRQDPHAPQQTLPSLETDMLHFGGVILEIVCGRRLSDRDRLPAGYSSLVEWVRALVHGGRRLHVAVNEGLKKAGDFNYVLADGLLRLGLHCSHSDPNQRSTIGNVLVKLAELPTEDTVEPIIVRQIRRNVSGTKRLFSASM